MKEKTIEAIAEKIQTGKIELKIKGKSMHPLLKEKDLIEIIAVKPEEIQTGDIIAYFNGTRIFVHRFIGWKKDKMLVKGDNNKEFDFLAEKKSCLGKVTKINNKKTDSIKFKLMKIPLTAVSYINGRIHNEIKGIK